MDKNIYEIHKSIIKAETKEQVEIILNSLNNNQLKELVILLMHEINKIYMETMLKDGDIK